jgi:hypothetical protein
VILTLKPVGRGNWRAIRIEIAGKYLYLPRANLAFAKGQTVELGGVNFRIFKVTA